MLHAHDDAHTARMLGESAEPCHPRTHLAWDLALELLIAPREAGGRRTRSRSGLRDGAGDPTRFRAFWTSCVDRALFSSTHERRALAFRLFERLLPRLATRPELLPVVFSENLIWSLVNNYNDAAHYLHKAACRVVDTLLASAQQHRSTVAPCALAAITGTRELAQRPWPAMTSLTAALMGCLDAEGVRRYVQYLVAHFIAPTTDADDSGPAVDTSELRDAERSAEVEREWHLDQLLAVVRNPRVPRADAWLEDIARFLITHALCTDANDAAVDADASRDPAVHVSPHANVPPGRPSPSLTLSTRDAVYQRLTTFLLAVLPQRRPAESPSDVGGEQVSQAGCAQDTRSVDDAPLWVQRVHELIRECAGPSSARLLHPVSAKAAKALEQMYTLCRRLQQHRQQLRADVRARGGPTTALDAHRASQLRVLELLALHIGLDLYRPDLAPAAADTIREIARCYDAIQRDAHTDDSRGGQRGVSGADATYVDVLVDIILSLLSRPSALLRAVAVQVFRVLCSDLTSTSLGLITDVLLIRDSEPTADGLLDVTDDERDDSSGDDAESSSGSDEGSRSGARVVGLATRSPAVDGQCGAHDSDGDVSEVDAHFRAQVRVALGPLAPPSEDEDGDGDHNDAAREHKLPNGADSSDGLAVGKLADRSAADDDSSVSSLDDTQMAELDTALERLFRQRRAAKTRRQGSQCVARVARRIACA